MATTSAAVAPPRGHPPHFCGRSFSEGCTSTGGNGHAARGRSFSGESTSTGARAFHSGPRKRPWTYFARCFLQG
eukprot:9176583-Pyramimonas_sp.AAC.1